MSADGERRRKPADPTRNVREVCARMLARWIKTDDFPDRMVESSPDDRAVVTEIVYGVARRRRALEWCIAQKTRRPPADDVAAALMVGLYQILYMDNVADHAAVNETVDAAKAVGGKSAAGFVNAVLRGVLRERNDLLDELARQPLGIRESHPDTLIERWESRFGAEAAARLCEWNNSRPETTIRLRGAAAARQQHLDALKEAGIASSPFEQAGETCLVLPRGQNPAGLPGFADGLFVVQDVATLAAVDALDPQPGDRVLDACAAPGGKAAMIADRLGGSGTLVALDRHRDRLKRLRENFERLKIGAEVVEGDATSAELVAQLGMASFDRILLDVPCTNTGVLRRRPDARWRFSDKRLASLCDLQSRMLSAVSAMLKPAGRLVYSTCSLEAEENTAQVEAWCAANPDFTLEDTRSLVPPDPPHDGAFVAVLTRG